MVCLNFNFCSKSDFSSLILLKESFRLAMKVLVSFFQFDSSIGTNRTFVQGESSLKIILDINTFLNQKIYHLATDDLGSLKLYLF